MRGGHVRGALSQPPRYPVLIGTQIEGVSGMSKAERTKEDQWEWATQLGSMPKLETLGVLVPGLSSDTAWTRPMAALIGDVPAVIQRGMLTLRPVSKARRRMPALVLAAPGLTPGIIVLLVSFWAFAQSLRKEQSVYSLPQRQVHLVSDALRWSCACCSRLAGMHRYTGSFFSLPFASTIRIPMKFYPCAPMAAGDSVCLWAVRVEDVSYMDSVHA